MTQPSPVQLDIQIVSDVVCPWCVIGSRHLLQALEELRDEVSARITWQPFQLNPHIGDEGENLKAHIMHKYGSSEADNQAMRDQLTALGQAAGFQFNFTPETRTWNTFDAHRAVHWAGLQGKQHAFMEALFHAYFTENRNPSDPATLKGAAIAVGLDAEALAAVIASDRYREDIEAILARNQAMGISGVPTIILDQKYAITGGQPVANFKQALQQVASERAHS